MSKWKFNISDFNLQQYFYTKNSMQNVSQQTSANELDTEWP